MKRLIFLVLFINLSLVMFIKMALSDEYCYKSGPPNCLDLAYQTTKDDCKSRGFSYIPCPFNEHWGTDWAYCTESCDDIDFPFDVCDDKIGPCEQCALGGKYRYTDCNEGYTKDGPECKLTDCGDDYTEGKLDVRVGDVKECKRGETVLYKYDSCKRGWDAVDGHCVQKRCDGDYWPISIGCPQNANCDDVCYEGFLKKAKIICNEGLSLQFAAGLAGDTIKCRKYNLGDIVFYCKSEDKIISLDPNKYDTHPEGCEPIGVVFYNDDLNDDGVYDYRVVGLKNIGYSSSAPYFVEQTNSSNPRAVWSNCTTCDTPLTNVATDKVLTTIENRNGAENTAILLKWVYDSKFNEDGTPKLDESGNPVGGYAVPSAQAANAYFPTICDGSEICGAGKWYLPSAFELYEISKRSASGRYSVDKSLEAIADKGVSFPISKNPSNKMSAYYQSSTEYDGGRRFDIHFNGGIETGGKNRDDFVRPALEIY